MFMSNVPLKTNSFIETEMNQQQSYLVRCPSLPVGTCAAAAVHWLNSL